MPKRHRTKYAVLYKKGGKTKNALRVPVGKKEAQDSAKILRRLFPRMKVRVEKVK